VLCVAGAVVVVGTSMRRCRAAAVAPWSPGAGATSHPRSAHRSGRDSRSMAASSPPRSWTRYQSLSRSSLIGSSRRAGAWARCAVLLSRPATPRALGGSPGREAVRAEQAYRSRHGRTRSRWRTRGRGFRRGEPGTIGRSEHARRSRIDRPRCPRDRDSSSCDAITWATKSCRCHSRRAASRSASEPSTNRLSDGSSSVNAPGCGRAARTRRWT
jgi:hypothetical protein